MMPWMFEGGETSTIPGKSLGDAAACVGNVVFGKLKANDAALVPSQPAEADGCLE
jgi:hypothetical protein